MSASPASTAVLHHMLTNLKQAAVVSQAALNMLSPESYCDFFVENGPNGQAFHEKCRPSDLTAFRFRQEHFSDQRQAAVQALLDADAGYCDFFVENGPNGKPFHEKCHTVQTEELLRDPAARAAALARLDVISAFNKAQVSATRTR